MLPSDRADLKLFFLVYHINLDYFCYAGVSAIASISVWLLLSVCDRPARYIYRLCCAGRIELPKNAFYFLQRCSEYDRTFD
ncbi:hypothetical protein [Microcoleus vaginatus]|uniref:hypothetical protein n=1 Tax=Microcoleus vaginatus TaxID=119532 RepID=UPI0032A1C634